MIPRNNNSQSAPARQSFRSNGLPYLGSKDCTSEPQPAKIVAARLQPDPFRAGQKVVAMRVIFRNLHWLLNLRTSNPNLDVLIDAWGDDESKWKDREMFIHNEPDDMTERVWLRLEPVTEDSESFEEAKPRYLKKK